MNEQQQKFIEDNIDLIKQNRWAEFFDRCTHVLWRESVAGFLYKAGFDFMTKLNYIPRFAFYESDIQTMVIPDNVTSINAWAFSDCSSLTSITIPNSVTSIGDWAFSDCSSLTSINIPDSVTSINDSTFYNCKGLTVVKIGEGVTNIGLKAFLNCKGLTSIVIPHSVTSIGGDAFCGCRGLTSIEIPKSVTSIGDDAFYDCDKITIKYDGTKSDWRDLIVSNSRVFKHTTYTCTCIDGIVKKSR